MDSQNTNNIGEFKKNQHLGRDDVLCNTNDDIVDLLTQKKGNLTANQYLEYVELSAEDSGDEDTYDEDTVTRKELRLFYLQCLLNEYTPEIALLRTKIEISSLGNRSINIDEIVNNKYGTGNEEEE